MGGVTGVTGVAPSRPEATLIIVTEKELPLLWLHELGLLLAIKASRDSSVVVTFDDSILKLFR
jgi:hypothetical protein